MDFCSGLARTLLFGCDIDSVSQQGPSRTHLSSRTFCVICHRALFFFFFFFFLFFFWFALFDHCNKCFHFSPTGRRGIHNRMKNFCRLRIHPFTTSPFSPQLFRFHRHTLLLLPPQMPLISCLHHLASSLLQPCPAIIFSFFLYGYV